MNPVLWDTEVDVLKLGGWFVLTPPDAHNVD